MRYPFKIRIDDPELDKYLSRLAKDRTVTINGNKNAVKKFSYMIRPIRKDIFIGWDKKTYESNISLKHPMLKFTIEQEKGKIKKGIFRF